MRLIYTKAIKLFRKADISYYLYILIQVANQSDREMQLKTIFIYER